MSALLTLGLVVVLMLFAFGASCWVFDGLVKKGIRATQYPRKP